MDWSPNTSLEVRKLRAEMYHDIRSFFMQHNVLEVETPALSNAGNTDPFIESIKVPFKLNSNAELTNRYLHTSPEYPMKRLLAAGSGDIYQICKVWRKGEIGDNHNPEFTLLEWYRVGFNYHELMQEVSSLLHKLLHKLIPTFSEEPIIYTYKQLFLEKFTIDPHIASKEILANCVKDNINGLETDNLDKQALLDALLTHCIEPNFEKNRLTFICDYPASQSALAQVRTESDYAVAERFEVYLGSVELGNGYQEEVDYQRNTQILQSENAMRKKHNLKQVTEDALFIKACKKGIPRSAGVAIGLDRVLMCISNEKSIQKVINFPWDKA
ncbi:MAG: EF-P lysine aminoacylase EpmA [Cocleimonas sp.]